MQRFKVLLNGSDDHFIRCLSAAFEERLHFEVIESSDPLFVRDYINQSLPEVVVWKIEEEDEEGIAVVVKEYPETMLIILINNPNRFDITKLMRMGVCGCLPTRLLPRQIVAAVELMVMTGILCYPRLNKEQLKTNGLSQMAIPYSLTPREREILTLLCRNYSNQEIAQAMCVAESTVKTHLHNIFRKMGINKRSDAISAVHQAGLFIPQS